MKIPADGFFPAQSGQRKKTHVRVQDPSIRLEDNERIRDQIKGDIFCPTRLAVLINASDHRSLRFSLQVTFYSADIIIFIGNKLNPIL